MHSCLYEGRVEHTRYEPVAHRFRYRLAMAYLDLDELDTLIGPRKILSGSRLASVSFRAEDHLNSFDENHATLAEAVRSLVTRKTGKRPEGSIRLLTQLRHFGFYFSPLNLYYCWNSNDEQLQAVVAEVSNTPWNERHHYVLHSGNQVSTTRYRHMKSFHVSPFMDMSATYDWRLSEPRSRLGLRIRSEKASQTFFHATMALRRHELSSGTARLIQLRYPFMSLKVMTAIYWQALILWKKKCPFFPHPNRTPVQATSNNG